MVSVNLKYIIQFFNMGNRNFFWKASVLLLCVGSIFAINTLANGSTIIAFGDSITAGYGSISGGYPPKLETLLAQHCKPSTVYNAGVGGEQTPEGLSRFDELLNSFPANFILIMEGANDVSSGISVETTQFNLQAMIDKCKVFGITPLLATLTPSIDPILHFSLNISGIR
jgi:lysophospholipase L1-like esterase